MTNKNKILISIRIKPTTKEKLEQLAEQNEMRLSEFMRNILEKEANKIKDTKGDKHSC